MNIPIGHSSDPARCVDQLKKGGGVASSLVLFFASSKLDVKAAALLLQESFPQSQVIGCSTAGEISSGSMTEGSMVAMALPVEYVDQVAAVYIPNPGDPAQVAAAIATIEAGLGQPVSDLDPSSWVGIVIVDGVSGAEEKLMERLGDLTDFPFIGGSAGDDLAFHKTQVCINGACHDQGAVIAVAHAPKGYQILKAQSFRSTGKRLTATAVDEANRLVLEFDGQPAAQAYASALGVSIDDLEKLFMRHPLGLMIAGEPFVRSPQRISGSGIYFYCNMREGTDLEIMDSTDIVADTAAVLTRLGADGGSMALINFNCILRTLELREKEQCEEFAGLFNAVPTIGFSTYGEEYMGHINQTSTMLVFPGA